MTIKELINTIITLKPNSFSK